MNKIIVPLLMTFIFFISSLSLNAQKDFQHDTTYYEKLADKITVRLYLSKKYVGLKFPSGGNGDDLEYNANPKLNLGAGVTIKNISINLFNGFSFLNKNSDKKRFSYRAALLQTEWQKKSAGSFIYGGEFHHGTVQGDSALIPGFYSSKFPQAGINKINVLSFGPGAGYAYTLVMAQHFFITGSMVINLDVNFIREEDETRKEKNVSLNPSNVFKAALGYNGRKWNVSANLTGSILSMQGSLTPDNYKFSSGNIRVVVAHKFETHKHKHAA